MPTFNRLPAYIAALAPKLSAAVHETADRVTERAQMLVPIDTGALQKSIEPHFVGAFAATVTAGNADGVDYAGFIETGTSRSRAQPFMTPAAELGRVEFVQAVEKAVQ